MMKFPFLLRKTIRRSNVATPNLKKASDKGEIAIRTYLAVIGVKAAVKVKKNTSKNFLILPAFFN